MLKISAPFFVGFQITGNCNLKCLYCYSSNSPKISISSARLCKIIDRLSDLGVFQFLIEGGEPMLHPEFFKVVEQLSKKELDFAILTNGLLLTTSNINSLKSACNIQKFPKIQISIDSHIPKINDISRGHGKKVIANIWKLLEFEIRPTLATVVHAQNIAYIYDFIDYFFPSITEFHFMNLMPTKSAKNNQDVLFMNPNVSAKFWNKLSETQFPDELKITHPYRVINKELGYGSLSCNRCFAGITSVNILPNLDVVACPIASNYILGNLSQGDFSEIWQSDVAEKIRGIKFPLCMQI